MMMPPPSIMLTLDQCNSCNSSLHSFTTPVVIITALNQWRSHLDGGHYWNIHVMLMIYAIGSISGMHMNLAINFVFVSKGVLPFAMVCITHTICLEPNFSIFYLIKFLPFATTKS
jgi:hypothetical protein